MTEHKPLTPMQQNAKLRKHITLLNKKQPNLVKTITDRRTAQVLGNSITTVKKHLSLGAGVGNVETHIQVRGQNFGTTLTKAQAQILAAMLLKACI